MLILPRTIFESDENQNHSFELSKSKKILKELCLPLLSFIFLTGIMLFIRFILNSSSYAYTITNRLLLLSQYEGNADYNTTSSNNALNSRVYSPKAHLLSIINHAIYSGNSPLNASQIDKSDYHNGPVYMQIILDRNDRPNALTIIVKAVEGNYADQWKEIQMKADFNSIKLSSTSNSFMIKGYTRSTIESNKLSSMNNKATDCNMSFKLLFTSDDDTSANIKEYNKVIGEIESINQSDSISFKFQLTIEESLADFHIISFYSVTLSSLCLCSLFNTIWLNVKLYDSDSDSDSEANANSISLLTIYQNVIWNSYGCLSHFFFTLNSIKYFIQFLFPTVLYFINFSICGLKLLYSLWRLKYSRIIVNQFIMKQRLIQLVCLFYVGLFISLFFVNRFYCNKAYNIFEVFLTWMPQIIYNAAYNNSISMPGVSIMIISITRLFFPCYCRGYSRNFFLIEPDYLFVTLCVSVMLSMIALMHSQMAYGPRFFLPQCLRKDIDMWECYKTMEELIKVKGDADKIECVICLNPLIDISDHLKVTTAFNHDFNNKISNDNLIQQSSSGSGSSGSSMLAIWKAFALKMFNFQKRNPNPCNKALMLTQCNHAFHSLCLESWLKRKKECPNCRKELSLG